MTKKKETAKPTPQKDNKKIGTGDLQSLDQVTLARIVADAAERDAEIRKTLETLLEQAQPTSEADGESRASMDESYMVGNSSQMRAVFEAIRRFAATNATVLITGESGTGKELAATAIHERSDRAKGPFIPINCGGLPSELIASELFGYERGAFTGASQRKAGRIEVADGGTVFLDEVGDLPIELQPFLLRFLQDGKIDRVGSQNPIKVDVRVIAATNSDLWAQVQRGRFREDLFYRLDVLSIDIPPLRERGNDIELLAAFFLQKFNEEMGRDIEGFTDAALDTMRLHPWFGNVRELISCLRRAVVMSNEKTIDVTALDLRQARGPQTKRAAPPPVNPLRSEFKGLSLPPKDLRSEIEDYEKILVQRALAAENNNIKRSADRLGVSRVTMYRLLEKHGLQSRKD